MPVLTPADAAPMRPRLRRPLLPAILLPAILLPAILLLTAGAVRADPPAPAAVVPPPVPTAAVITPTDGIRSLRILSFNVEHAMSDDRFVQWRAFCEPLGWREPAAGDRPERLTFCNALDGTDGRGKRLFAPVRDTAGLRHKLEQVARLTREADADIVLLQEVSDAAVARRIVGPHHRVVTTDELWGGPIAQHLAVAWRTTLPGALPEVAVVEAISRTGPDGRRTRPGLAITVDAGPGHRLAILNLHLKAGCRHGRLDEATSRKPDRAYRREAACGVFREQIPAIESWADATLRAGTGVIIAGDFNRDVAREIRDRFPARADGSDPAGPADPALIAGLLAELSDGSPPTARFSWARAGPYGKLADCHRHIDGFLLSAHLAPWLAKPPQQLRARVIPFAEPISLDRVRPSDHCPHVLDLPLRAATGSPPSHSPPAERPAE